MKTKLLFITFFVTTFLSAQSIEFTSAELTTAEVGSTITVDYKYTVAADGYIYCGISLQDDWTWTSEVANGELTTAVAGTDITGSFNLTIPAETTLTANLTGDFNYKINIELKQTPDQSTWLAGAYPSTWLDFVATGTLSTNDVQPKLNNITVYPNPTRNTLQIKGVNFLDISKVKIVNILGKEVYSSHLKNSNIDVSNLNAGIYIVTVESDEKLKRIKFIKQ
jgi:hypothetical protein